MSVRIASKADIDAIVTVALRWTESGALEHMPDQVADVLRVTPENATEIGALLWRANHDSFNYGGPRELVEPEVLAEVLEYGAEEMPEYTFAELPGIPVPEVVVRLTSFYRYQTQCDHWDQTHLYADGEPPFEACFIVAMEWHAMTMLHLASDDRVPEVAEWIFVNRFADFPEDRFPAYRQVPWGLDDGDRQLFISTADGQPAGAGAGAGAAGSRSLSQDPGSLGATSDGMTISPLDWAVQVPELDPGVALTLELALVQLDQDAPAAAGLARLLAFLAPEPAPLGLLLAKRDAARQLGKAAGALRPLLGDPVAASDAAAALRQCGLAAPAGDGLIQVDRLIQAVIRALLTPAQARQWQQAAAAVVEAAVPDDGAEPTGWSACALLPHARAVLDLTGRGIWRLGLALGRSGSYAAARDVFALIADARRDSEDFGPEHRTTLGSRTCLAHWTGEAGDAAGARDQYAALLPVRERVSGPEHADTLASRANLAYWTGAAGDPAGACAQYVALLPIIERVCGPEYPHTLAARGNLALYIGEAGDAAGARDQCAALLPVRERVSGPEHPYTLIARGNLARWTGEAGDAAGARDQFAAVLELRERVCGPEHPDTVTVRGNLARWTGAAGDAAGARDQYAALLEVRERISGPEHPYTLGARSNLARWTGEAGDAAGARDQFAALLELGQRLRGPEHPDIVTIRASLARWTAAAGG